MKNLAASREVSNPSGVKLHAASGWEPDPVGHCLGNVTAR